MLLRGPRLFGRKFSSDNHGYSEVKFGSLENHGYLGQNLALVVAFSINLPDLKVKMAKPFSKRLKTLHSYKPFC